MTEIPLDTVVQILQLVVEITALLIDVVILSKKEN